MKKNYCFFVVLFILSMAVYAQSGVIKELAGTVEIKDSGAASFVAARQGDTVSENTIISTGFRSSALIELGSASITVRPLTRLSLAEIRSSAGTETLNLTLQAGRIKVDVKPAAGIKTLATVQSSVATAAVRGTSFEMDTRKLRVLEGTVGYRGNNGVLLNVPAGLSSTAKANGVITNPYEGIREGLPPSAPVGYDRSGASSGRGGFAPGGVTLGIYIVSW